MLKTKFRVVFFLIGITVLGLVGFALKNDWDHFWNNSINIQQQDFQITRGASGQSIIKRLIKLNLVQNKPLYIKFWLKYLVPNGQFKKGFYRFQGEFSPQKLLTRLVQGKVHYFEITIIPGWTFKQALALIQANVNLKQDLDVYGKPFSEKDEGSMFPDTYSFTYQSKASSLLGRTRSLLTKRLQQVWQQRNKNEFIKTPREMLILASIVEKETSLISEKPRIARVFLNRLQKHMRLQTDPTVIYGIGENFNGNITRKDLKTDTIYNTYTRFGLPPTPIALADFGSLKAVANPMDTDDLYFVADGSGGHVFSKTLQQHNANVAKYLLHKRKK